MSQFFVELWESIFTPGPTPTLLVATNATFSCLQVLLTALLFATGSIHFVILSALCAGLWWAINWFARELKAHQQREEESARRAQEAASAPIITVTSSNESETEVEGPSTTRKRGRASRTPEGRSHEVEVVEPVGDVKQRHAPPLALVTEAAAVFRPASATDLSTQDTRSGVSTEDEWEKVSENEHEKDK